MKKTKAIIISALALVVALGLYSYFTLSPVVAQKLQVFKGDNNFMWGQPKLDKRRKTVFIVADNDATEMFDLMAPFYLFNATEQANVFVVSEKKAPILLVNSLFILPHYSFSEADALHIIPDVIVIPNVTVHLNMPPKQSTVRWIKSRVSTSTIVLAICDGSATAAATGLYDGKPLTTHASDFKTLKKQFPKPLWVRNTSVTQSGNLYSTAGVSNAVEGSLTVIKRLFGEQTMQAVLKNVRYPHDTVQIAHQSEAVGTGSIIRIASKVLLKKNYRIGVLLHNGVNEFELGGLLDTYARTFPSSLATFSASNMITTSKYGLTLYPTGDSKAGPVNELHVLNTEALGSVDPKTFAGARIVNYESLPGNYPINLYLDRIALLYGEKFERCVKLTLDYN